jgi:hypothetical protein
LRLTSLPPPEDRGFVPRDEREPDEELTIRQKHRELKYERWRNGRSCDLYDTDKLRGFMPPWSLPDPSWQYNSNPWQENAIKAWEECDL